MWWLLKTLLALFALAVVSSFSTRSAYAASATLYLSPASATVAPASTLTVDVRVHTGGEEVNAVQANLSYPNDKLEFVSITSSSAFNIPAGQDSGGGGSVKIGRGALPPASGDQLVATVEFKVTAQSGAATITFASGSSVKKGGAEILGETQGGNYTIKAAEQTPPATKSSPKDIVKPVIKNIEVTRITKRGATISWQTSEPATSEIHYGLNTSYGLIVADDDLATNHKLVLDSDLLRPDTKYHYRIRSVDAAGNEAYSSDQTFMTLEDVNGLSNGSTDLPQPAIFNTPPTTNSPNPLGLIAGLTSLVISGVFLLLSLDRYGKMTPLIDRILVSELSKHHKKALKRSLHSHKPLHSRK